MESVVFWQNLFQNHIIFLYLFCTKNSWTGSNEIYLTRELRHFMREKLDCRDKISKKPRLFYIFKQENKLKYDSIKYIFCRFLYILNVTMKLFCSSSLYYNNKLRINLETGSKIKLETGDKMKYYRVPLNLAMQSDNKKDNWKKLGLRVYMVQSAKYYSSFSKLKKKKNGHFKHY